MSRPAAAETSAPQDIRFCVAYTGNVRRVLLIGEWPALTLVSAELLAKADPALLRRAGDRLYFSVANGTAEYLIVREEDETWSGGLHRFHCARLYAQREEPGG